MLRLPEAEQIPMELYQPTAGQRYQAHPERTITNAGSAATSVTGLVQGTYQFQLTVTDNSGGSNQSTVQVTVNAANILPTANAGNRSINNFTAQQRYTKWKRNRSRWHYSSLQLDKDIRAIGMYYNKPRLSCHIRNRPGAGSLPVSINSY